MRITYSDHLVALVGRAEAAGARLAGAPAHAVESLIPAARRLSARLSARLDASPLTDETADDVDRRGGAALAGGRGAVTVERDDRSRPGWAQALKLDGMATQDVAAVEYANLLACFDAEPILAPAVFDQPREVLVEVHGLVSQGLVDPDVIGRVRRSEQAIHDGAQGRVIYAAPPPDALEPLVADLVGWLRGRADGLPALLVAGIVQERLLQWQVFESANGRVARVASRLVLRARGLDPHGVAVPERVLAGDAVGYYGEVAATIRRRDDLGLWLERYGEAAVVALEQAADAVAPATAAANPAPASLELASALAPGQAITVAEFAEAAQLSHFSARRELEGLARAGVVALEPRTRGLRFRRC